MMTPREFAVLVLQDPTLSAPLQQAAKEIPKRSKSTYVKPLEMAEVVALFPLVLFVVKNIGLPWLYEAKTYSKLWQENFRHWADEQYRRYNMDSEALVAAGRALRKELEALSEKEAQKSWEQLTELLEKE